MCYHAHTYALDNTENTMLEAFLHEFIHTASLPVLLLILLSAVLVLGKAADQAIACAVKLARATGLSNVVIGATIVSLGTTFPEAVVSVLAAVRGDAGLALGNAVGSIICDTGLIMGLTCLLGRVPIDKFTVRRKGVVQLLAVLLLVLLAVPQQLPRQFSDWQGVVTQWEGFLLVLLLVAYLVWSLYTHSKESKDPPAAIAQRTRITLSLLAMLLAVIVASEILIISSVEFARRIEIPEAIIAATIVAFGTSLPELMTALSAVRRNACDLALGNVLGADILNVLFVAGAAASVSPAGLVAEHYFFTRLFPAMLIVVLVLQYGLHTAAQRGTHLARWNGAVLLGVYAVFIGLQLLRA